MISKNNLLNQKFIPSLEEREIVGRINWLISLRWFAIIGVLLTIIFSTKILLIELPIKSLFSILILIAIYNLMFLLYSNFFLSKRMDAIGIQAAIRFANVQISVDLFALISLIHFSGGIENPFSFYFIFHMIIASILLSTKSTYWQATLAVILYTLMVFLEYSQVIPHYSLKKFILDNTYLNIYYVTGNLFVFSSTMYLSVYMATSITRRLRKRQREIISLKEELEAKHKQLEETQATLIQSEKMSALGQFSAGIAHEIKNPLTGVFTYIKLMRKNIMEDKINLQEFKDRLSIMEQETDRCVKIIKNLLDFSRQSEPSFKEIDINSLLEDSLSFIQHHAELEKVKIIKELNPDLPKVNVDPDQLQQVFVNIILNAIQAMQPEGGTLTIKTDRADTDGVYIKFTDTGCGISEDNMKKLFTPFFTTKPKGSGLGLAVCYGIIEKHKGKIEVESKLGEGTTFTVKLGGKDGEI